MDPATAHGITEALLDAGRLASSWIEDQGSLGAYRDRRDAHTMAMFAITQRIASFDWDLDELVSLHVDLNNEMRSELAGVDGMLVSRGARDWRTEPGAAFPIRREVGHGGATFARQQGSDIG
ncbi:hypothetical protein [Mesorhizobium marinum]